MHTDQPKRLDFFERYLTVWVFACMAVGIGLGKLLPSFTRQLSLLQFGRNSHVNIPIAVLIWLMIYPMMLKIDFGGLKNVAQKPKGLLITLFVNWLVKPFSMALLGWVFMQWLFSSLLGWIPNGGREKLHGGPDHPGGGALHRDGLCLELSDGWRCALYVGASRR